MDAVVFLDTSAASKFFDCTAPCGGGELAVFTPDYFLTTGSGAGLAGSEPLHRAVLMCVVGGALAVVAAAALC